MRIEKIIRDFLEGFITEREALQQTGATDIRQLYSMAPAAVA
jgi:hypothetical protein